MRHIKPNKKRKQYRCGDRFVVARFKSNNKTPKRLPLFFFFLLYYFRRLKQSYAKYLHVDRARARELNVICSFAWTLMTFAWVHLLLFPDIPAPIGTRRTWETLWFHQSFFSCAMAPPFASSIRKMVTVNSWKMRAQNRFDIEKNIIWCTLRLFIISGNQR